MAFEALDNGILTCADPATMQAVADEISTSRIDALFAKWPARLPPSLLQGGPGKGIHYDLSILQAECALTQVFDRPHHGRVLFEEVKRENLDVGRSDRVQLIFDRRVIRHTPSRFRTRVITDGVTPSLHVDYKHSRIKQSFKEGRALRTETVINDTYDFGIKRRLINLDDLKEAGFGPTDVFSSTNAGCAPCVSAIHGSSGAGSHPAPCLPALSLQQPPDEGGGGTAPRHRGLRLAPGHL